MQLKNKLEKNALPLFVLGLTLSVVLLGVKYISVPLVRDAGRIAHSSRDLQAIVESPGTIDRMKKALTDTHTQLLEKNAKTVQASVELQSAADVMNAILEKSKNAGIDFVKIQPQEDTRSHDTGRYPVLLEMTSTYRAIGMFIGSLESQPQNFSVERLSVLASEKDKAQSLTARIAIICTLSRNK